MGDVKLENAIFDFTWDRLDTLGDIEIDGFKELQEKIDKLKEELIKLIEREDIRELLNAIEETCTEQSALVEEKAYRLGFKDGLKFLNCL